MEASKFVSPNDPTVANLKISCDCHGGILAHSFSPTDGRFHFHGDETWVTGAVADSMDLRTVATHEIGHLLRLAHGPVEEAVMYAFISPGEPKGLNQDDIHGIREPYTPVDEPD